MAINTSAIYKGDLGEWYKDPYTQITTGDAVVPWEDTIVAPTPTYNLDFADEAVVIVDNDFRLTGKEFKRCLKVLMKIVEEDYPEELL